MKKLLVTFAAVAVIPLTLFLVMAEPDQPPPAETDTVMLPQVTVIKVETGRHQPKLTGYAQVNPRYQLQLAAEVVGRVTAVSESLESGQFVAEGDLLLSINDTPYRQAVASAESALAQARVQLMQEEREVKQAQKDWKRSGLEGEPDSPLLLRKPQRNAAAAQVVEAEAALVQAKEDLERTQIRAPFDGVILSREVAPGSYIQPGMIVAELYASDRVEAKVPMPAHFWKTLPEEILNLSVQLRSHDGLSSWQAYVLRQEQHLNVENRQRSLIVAVDLPLQQVPALLPGSFVTAEIPGIQLDRVLEVPASALTRSGQLWYVDQNNHLQAFDAEPLFQFDGKLLVEAPEGITQLRLLTNPLKSYLIGMLVKVTEVKHD